MAMKGVVTYYTHMKFISTNGHCIPTETGRAHCQRQVAFLPFYIIFVVGAEPGLFMEGAQLGELLIPDGTMNENPKRKCGMTGIYDFPVQSVTTSSVNMAGFIQKASYTTHLEQSAPEFGPNARPAF